MSFPVDHNAEIGSAPAKRPAIRLDHAALVTADLERAVTFYTHLLGLTLHSTGDDPIREGRRRALLADDQGSEVLELMEMPEMAHPAIAGRGGIHHLGFCLTSREWHALRSRMDASGHAYQQLGNRLFARDPDGVVLEIVRA